MGCYKHRPPEVVLAWFDDTLSVLNDLPQAGHCGIFGDRLASSIPSAPTPSSRIGIAISLSSAAQPASETNQVVDCGALALEQVYSGPHLYAGKIGNSFDLASLKRGLMRLPVMAFRGATGLNFARADRHADGFSISGGTTPALYDRVKAVFPETIIFFPLSLNETQVLALVDDFLASRILFSRGVILGAPGLAGD
jgi:hypothetical protein